MRWMALILLFAAACGESGTGGEAVRYTLGFESMGADGSTPGRFTTASGWDVELDEARIALGPVYLFTNEPPSASLLPRMARWIVPVAHAHSGFDEFDGGTVRGELLSPVIVDALAPGVQQAQVLAGVAGPVRSSTIELVPVNADELHGGQAWVSGVARKGTSEVRFAGALQLPADAKSRRVVGVPADLELGENTEVVVELHPAHWLGDADFDSLPAAGGDGVRPITPESQVHAAWFIGARGYGSFTVR